MSWILAVDPSPSNWTGVALFEKEDREYKTQDYDACDGPSETLKWLIHYMFVMANRSDHIVVVIETPIYMKNVKVFRDHLQFIWTLEHIIHDLYMHLCTKNPNLIVDVMTVNPTQVKSAQGLKGDKSKKAAEASFIKTSFGFEVTQSAKEEIIGRRKKEREAIIDAIGIARAGITQSERIGS